MLSSIRNRLDDEGKQILAAYLALVENCAPFMVSGLASTYQSIDSTQKTDTTSVEFKSEVAELKKYIDTLKKQGFTNEEIRSSFLEMSSYKHLRQVIIDMTEEGETEHA